VRDLTWCETLEPKFQQLGVGAAAMKEFREQWHQHAERRDWAWWQTDMERFSDAEIDEMRMDCFERFDALGLLRWRTSQQAGEARSIQQIREEESGQAKKQPSAEKSPDEYGR
jgi:hypothetical protein